MHIIRAHLPVIVLAVLSIMSGNASGAERLTGDWSGERTSLAEHGVTIDVDSTNYYQGLLSGTGDKQFEYGGRLDGNLTFNTGKLGMWDGGAIRLHAEYFFGGLDPNLGGTVAPTNIGIRLPNPGDKGDLVVTNIALTQKLSDHLTLIAGKINTVDLIAGDPFFGGAGVDRFLNLAFAAPPNGLLPPVIMGGILSAKTAPLDWTFMVYDPEDRTQDYWPDDLFGTGVNVSVGAKHTGLFAGRTSSIAVTGIYSTANSISLGEVLLPPGLQTGEKNHSWHANIQFAHYLHESAANAADGWGVFVKMGASDGNPNPFQAWITGGIGGKGLFPARPADTFGLGYFYYNLSDDLQGALVPLGEFNNEQGVEAYYNFAVNQWLNVSVDLQYVNPATAVDENALVGALRVKIRL